LASGFSASPQLFNPAYVALISSGERAGILDRTLEALTKSLDRSQAVRSRIVQASVYPLLVLIILCGVTVFMLTWIIPTFEELFVESGAALPWLTRQVILLSHTLLRWWHYALGALGLGIFIIGWFSSALPSSRSYFEQLKLKTPLLSILIRSRLTCECALLVSALIGAGIPIIQALRISAETIQHKTLSQELMKSCEALLEGASLTQAIKGSSIFPPLATEMIAVGETSGQLEEMLSKVGIFFEQELEEVLKTLHNVAEPVLILSIGLVVGTLVLAMYLPLFQLGQLTGVH
jgi:type II secretory pathway component PulF